MKTLQELINEGIEIKSKCRKEGYMGQYISSEKYEHWLMYCIRYLQEYFPEDAQTEYFQKIAKEANNNSVSHCDTLIGILNAFLEVPSTPKNDYVDFIIEKITTNFHRCAKSILNRHSNRQTLKITDEYDVQDLLQGILRLFFDDIIPEDYVPSYAGGSSRIDFHLREYETYIETKMTRENLKDKEIGDQLIIDIARYGNKCKKLICFIYDGSGLLKNPYGLIKDLEKLSTNDLTVKVYIAPI